MKQPLRLSSLSSWSLQPLRPPPHSSGALLPSLSLLSSLLATLFSPQVSLAQLQANQATPANQHPVLLRSASGVPQVDITRPTTAGVSINQFRQFDVDVRGAVINNGRKASQTALAGWIAANPALLAGEASVIINEVRSADPSLLKGYIEIAGGKAEMVFANPAGIRCHGCGFIHATRVELATARPELANGRVAGYLPGNGVLEIAGRGLDATRIDILSLLTQAARVNAGIWANELKLTLKAPSPSATPVNKIPLPEYALDVAAIGGMYANRIWLVGTAQGLGVRNAGNWSATDTLSVSIDGKLENSAGIDARELVMRSTAIDNVAHGTMLGDRIALQAERIVNAGHPDASPAIAAAADLDLGVRTLENTGQATIFAGKDMRIGRQLDADDHAIGKADRVLNRFATIEAQGKLTIHAARLQNQNAGVDIEEMQIGQTVPVAYLQPNGSGPKYTMDHFYWAPWSRAGQYKWVTNKSRIEEGIPGKTPLPDVDGTDCIIDGGSELCMPTPGSAYPKDDPAWAYFKLTPPDPPPAAPGIEPKLPSVIQPPPWNPDASAEEKLAWTKADAEYKVAMAEYQLRKEAYDQVSRDYDQWHTTTSERREALNAAISKYNTRFAGIEIRSWRQYFVKQSEFESRVASSAPARIIAGSDITLAGDELLNDRSQLLAGGQLSGDLQNLQNIEAEGTHRIHETGTSQYSRSSYHGWLLNYHTREWGPKLPYEPADQLTTIRLPVTVVATEQAGALPAPAVEVAANRFAADGSSLFRAHLSTGPLFVTDPRLTRYRQWLSSDAMLARLNADPERLQKRIGDGYIEQRLVREQIAQLTGRRFLPGQDNDEAQYAALMNSGVSQSAALQLVPGIALSALQVAKLTSDIVWLVAQDLALPSRDGQPARTLRVLVPQVYLVPRTGDVDGTGTLISAQRIQMAVADAIDNAGTITGADGVQLQARTIRVSGNIAGDTAVLAASDDIDLRGGNVKTRDDQWLLAGRDIHVASTSHDSHQQSATRVATGESSRTNLDRTAMLHVTGNGNLSVLAGRDIALDGARLHSDGAGQVAVIAGQDLVLGTLATRASTAAAARGSANFISESQHQAIGTEIQANGAVGLNAGRDLGMHAARIDASQGNVKLSAVRDLTIKAGESGASDAQGTEFHDSGLLGSGTSTRRTASERRDAVASTVGGNSVKIAAGRDLQVAGSDIAGDLDTRLQAGRDANIVGVTETASSDSFSHDTRSGLFSGSGLSITIGTQQQQQSAAQRITRQRSSQIGSLSGDVGIEAGGTYRQQASQVIVPAGSVSIRAKDVAIIGGQDTMESRQASSFSQSGLGITLSNPIIDAGRSLESLHHASQATHNGRTQALAVAAAGLHVANTAKAVASDPSHAGGVTLAVTIGSSKAESNIQQKAISVAPSLVAAQKNIAIRAQGEADSSLTIAASTANAGDAMTLSSDGSVSLEAQADTSAMASTSNSHSMGIGLAAGMGQGGIGIGLIANAGQSRGQASGKDIAWTNTEITGGVHTSLHSKGDTRLTGAIVKAPTIDVRVGGDLVMESLQDSSRYDSHQKSVSGSVTIPLMGGRGASAQFNAGKSDITDNYLSTTKATGIQAGDGGFDVSVAGKTTLKGASIASTDAAVAAGRNKLSSAELAMTDLQNRADYDAHVSSAGIGTGRNPQGTYVVQGNSAGLGSDSGHQASVTTSGVSGIAGNLAVRTGDASAGLANHFDAERVAKEINAQVLITQEFSGQAYKVVGDYVEANRKALWKKIEESRDKDEKQRLNDELKALRKAEQVMNILIGAVIGVGGTAITKEGLSSAAEKMRALMIEDSKRFTGVTDGITTISNNSGKSSGVRGDKFKLGGTRVDLDLVCGLSNENCEVVVDKLKRPILDSNGKTQLLLDSQGQVQFSPIKAGMSLEKFLATEKGQEIYGTTGGIQGYQGTLFGIPYAPGSWQDKLIEAFSGTHDSIGGNTFGLYDKEGNAKRGMSNSERWLQNAWSTMAIVPSAPFAAAEALPPEVWQAIRLLLGAGH